MATFSLLRAAVIAGTAVVVALVPGAGLSAPSTSDGRAASAHVRDVSNTELGTLYLTRTGDGKLLVAGRFRGLPPGFHGFHIHAVGRCDPSGSTPFASAGPHLNPSGHPHGQHAGDLPMLYVAADGRAWTALETDALRPADLFDADGSAVIIHASPDNYAHIPARYSAAGAPGPDAATLATGDAGARLACGVIRR